MGLSRLAAIAIAFAALNGAIAVGAGAWAAHGREGQAGLRAVELARTASQFQLWHALALLAATLVAERLPPGGARRCAVAAMAAFALGLIGFSGSLYVLVMGGRGALAPFGGMALILGWLLLALAGLLALRRP